MAKTQLVTIPLEEYKELLLKDKPSNSDHELVNRILNEITKHLKYSDSKYNSGHVGNEMKVEDPTDVIKEILLMIKYIDFDRYMKIWNYVQSEERRKKAMEDQIDQMNRAKELRNSE